jgi:hypothetical protein
MWSATSGAMVDMVEYTVLVLALDRMLIRCGVLHCLRASIRPEIRFV